VPPYHDGVAIRVVLAEDDALLREGLAQLVIVADGLELVGTAVDLPSAIAVVAHEQPDVVVTDIRMPPGQTDEGIQLAARLRREHPAIGVVVLSKYAEPAYALALLDGGVQRRGYLLKERVSRFGELAEAARRVAAGGSVIDPTVVGDLVATHRARRSALDELSPRELQVLREIAQGKNNAAVAAALTLTERAVEKHANAIFAKLGLTNEPDINRRVSAVLVYLNESR
jgi:DNA-binding NarL/FixJ family response regulator